MMLQIHRSDTLALMQLLPDLPLQHDDLLFNMNIYMYQYTLYSTIDSFLNINILNT